MSKVYNSSVDFRVLSNELKFVFYVSGRINGKNYKKRKCFSFTYNTQSPAEVFVKTDNNLKRLFLRFSSHHLTLKRYLDNVGVNNSDIILEVFKGDNGKYSFNSVLGKEYGAFLSHINYYNPNSSTKSLKYSSKEFLPQSTSAGIVTGALKLPSGSDTKSTHPIQMIVPSIGKNNLKGLSFDMDILSEHSGQYIKSLSFNCDVTDNIILEGFTPDIIIPKQIIVPRKKVELTTVYLKLDNGNMGSGEVIYDYKKQLTKQNIPVDAIELMSSKVYAIENEFNVNANLSEFNLGTTNKIQIPYNVSREVNDGEIKEEATILVNGKEISSIGWASEIRNNKIFSSVNKCISLEFTNEQQQIAFSEKLKKQQIGSKETYNVVDKNGATKTINRVYSDISQWIKRTTLNQFNDVRFTYDNQNLIKEILICPRKKTMIGSTKSGRQNGLYTPGKELLLEGSDYIGEYHIGEKSSPYTGRSPKSENIKGLRFIRTETPIQENSNTDFCFTTYGRYGGVYSAHTSAITNTYDVTISGSSISANTVVPISDFNLNKPLPLIGDYTERYRPYAFHNVYNEGVILNETNSTEYMTYSAHSSGLYRLTYKGHLTVEYKDTKWCEYLSTVYASAMTGTYPSTNYEIKRLINTSLINAGVGETNTALMDTNFKYYPGERGKNANGIIGFYFTVSLVKTSSGGTESTLAEYKVLRSDSDGVANDYLKLQVTDMDKSSSAFTICDRSVTSASTIFEYNGTVNVDTGFVNLIKGDKVQLKYSCVSDTTSKLGTGGTSTITVNLGHKLDGNGVTSEAPFFRAIKSANSVRKKQLFFDATEKSQGFEIVKGNTRRSVNLDGTLYITDNGCNTLMVPKVDSTTFNNLTFVDSKGVNNVLKWDMVRNKPMNAWQSLIENNVIKDYTLKGGTTNYMTKMSKNGVFKVCLPQYNQDYNATCLYTFPQQRHSYVVVNTFKDLYGKNLLHYIVMTPTCGLFTPCSTEKALTSYDILHKTTPDKWRVVNVDKKITIDGKVITIVDPTIVVKPESTSCQYYCKCNQDVANKLKLDPIFGISEIMADTKSNSCVDCIKRANDHCKKMNAGCEPVVINYCAESGNLIKEVVSGVTPIKPKGVLPNIDDGDDGTNPGPENPRTECEYGKCRYTCYNSTKGGIITNGNGSGAPACIEDPRGFFEDLAECKSACKNKSGSGGGGTRMGYDCVQQNPLVNLDNRGKIGIGASPTKSGCIETKGGRYTSIEQCNKVCTQRQCGCRCEPGGCDPDKPKGCGEWNNWCGSGSGNGDGDSRWNCFEGLCFEDRDGQYDSIEKCKEKCVKVKTESKSEIREKAQGNVISDAEKEKQKIDIIENPLTPPEIVDDLIESGGGTDTDTSGGICPDGSYFCKTINECLPSDTPCPK
mgnify:FL=1